MTDRLSFAEFKDLVLRRDAYFNTKTTGAFHDASNPNADAVTELHNYMSHVLIMYGDNKRVDPRGISWLIHDPNDRGMLDAEALMHPDAPIEDLEWAYETNAGGKERNVAYWLSANPSCPDSILGRIAAQKRVDWKTLKNVVNHSNVSEQTLRVILRRPNLQVKARRAAKERLFDMMDERAQPGLAEVFNIK